MDHPHKYLLEEFKISLDKLVPLTPVEVIEEGNKLHQDLLANEAATEREIRQALVTVGRKEYPYRKAYMELCSSDEEKRLQAAVFERLEPAVLEKVKAITDSGVHVLDYVNSKLFERDLDPTERYQIEQAILLAHDVLNRQCDERAKERAETFDQLVAKWRGEEDRLQGLIDQLRTFAVRDAVYADEIRGKADQFEEGWSVVERDPEEQEIKKEIEYWQDLLKGSEDGAEAL